MFSINNFEIAVCLCFFSINIIGSSHAVNWALLVIYVPKVLGAAMFYAKVGDTAIVYTGDYNMTPDRHLGAAQIDRLQLDLLITEYGTCVCRWMLLYLLLYCLSAIVKKKIKNKKNNYFSSLPSFVSYPFFSLILSFFEMHFIVVDVD